MESRRVWKGIKKRDIPSDRRLIGSRWVFRVKRNGVFRARLVALGYSQIPGVDFTDNFAPIINEVTFRIMLVMMMVNKWGADIIDIVTAFLCGELLEKIYKKIPQGLNECSKQEVFDKEEDCLMFDKALYGLVQEAREFHKKLITIMITKMKFQKSFSDPCLVYKKDENGTVMLGIYVDECLCIGDRQAIENTKSNLKRNCEIKDEGPMQEYVVVM